MLNAFYCFPTNTDYIKTPSYPMWLSVKHTFTHTDTAVRDIVDICMHI